MRESYDHNVQFPLVKDKKVSIYLFPKRKYFDHHFHSTLHGRVLRECDIVLCVPYKPKSKLFNCQIISCLNFLVNHKTKLQDCRPDPDHRGKSKNDIYQSGDELGLAVDGLLTNGVIREDDTWEKHIVESMRGREFIAYLKVLATTPQI